MYDRCGFGLYLVALRESGAPIGTCGLIKREGLEDVDLGFAFLEAHWGKGYAHESAAGVVAHARRDLGLERLVAITSLDNHRSIKVLEKLGLVFEGTVRLPGDGAEVGLFACGP